MSGPISGHVYRHDGARGPVWRAKYRLSDGRQVHRKIGPAWTGRGRPPAGFYTRRLAQEWLDAVLVRARAGVLEEAQVLGAGVVERRARAPGAMSTSLASTSA
jgi:hypothetical protein